MEYTVLSSDRIHDDQSNQLDIRSSWLHEASWSVYPIERFVKPCLKLILIRKNGDRPKTNRIEKSAGKSASTDRFDRVKTGKKRYARIAACDYTMAGSHIVNQPSGLTSW